MTRIRLAWTAALALLLAPLTQAAEADKYTPDSATIVVSVNVRQLLDSPLGKKYGPDLLKTALEQNAQVRQLLASLGVDPIKDVDSLFLAASTARTEDAILVVRGRIDPERFARAAEQVAKQDPRAMRISKDNGLTIYEGSHDGSPAFATFPGDGALVISPSRKALLAVSKGGKLGKDLAPVVEKLDGKQAIWMAALMPAEAKKALEKQPQTADLADKVKAFTGTIEVDRDLRAVLAVHTTQAKAADSVAELLDGLKGLGKLYAGSVPQVGTFLGQVVDTVKIETDRTTVNVRMQVTADMIEQAVKAAQAPAKPAIPRRQ